MSSINDTSAEAYAVQLKRMAMDAIRRRHRLKFIEVTYGKELADDVRRSYEERDNG